MIVFLMYLVLLLVTTLIISWYYKYLKFEKHLKKFSGPPTYPIIGHLHLFTSTKAIIPSLMNLQKRYGGTYRIYLGMEPNLIFADQQGLEFILSSNSILEKTTAYEFLKNWLGSGLLTSTGKRWRTNRKILTPAFHFKILEEFVDIFNSASDTLVNKLNSEIEEDCIDIYPFVTLCSLDIICESAMGTSVNAQENSNSEYVNSVKLMTKIIIERAFSPIQKFDFLYYFMENCRLEKKALKILHTFTNNVIQQRKLYWQNKKTQEASDEFGVKRRLAFLDLLLQSTIDGKPLPDEMIREEVDTFMFEGHDTTSSAISFVLFCLANHGDVQSKVVEELQCILSDDWLRNFTFKDLQEMKYMELAIKESLRLYPPVPLIGRRITEYTEYDGKILRKGIEINIDIYGLHNNPSIYPNPEVFDPDRFLLEKLKNKNPYIYVPFSAGPRNCIGQKFAMLEIKSVVGKILRNFELMPAIPAHEPILLSESILKSENGIRIVLKPRKM